MTVKVIRSRARSRALTLDRDPEKSLMQLAPTLDNYIYAAVIIMAVFFMIEKYMFYNMTILGCLTVFMLLRAHGKVNLPFALIVFFGYALLLLIQIIFTPSPFFSINMALKELARISIYSSIAFVVANIDIRNTVFTALWEVTFLLTLIIAIVQYLKWFEINDLLVNMYGDGIHLSLTKYDGLDQFRTGSIFINPNSYSKFLIAFLGVYLGYGLKPGAITVRNLVMFAAIGLAFILTGSRTGFVGALFVLASFFIINRTRSPRLRTQRGYTYLLVISLMLVLIFLGIGLGRGGDTLQAERSIRLLRVGEGVHSSLNYKFTSLQNMLSHFDALNAVIGLGPFEGGIRYLTHIDFDIGYITAFYGAAGIALYALMLVLVYLRWQRIGHYNPAIVPILIGFILFGFTGGMLLNLRTFAIYSLVFFANPIGKSAKLL